MVRVIQQVQPDDIYNLAAQSHVAVSFEEPEYTANADGVGALRLLEAIRILGLEKKRHASIRPAPPNSMGWCRRSDRRRQRRSYPRSPYAVAKLYAYWISVNYREAYGLYACNGILFNHESPIRGETFVTRKIMRAIARIALGLQECLSLGNLAALRDCGHARDYVEMQWLMLQQSEPEDFVIATGRQYSVRQLVLGIELKFDGKGERETAVVTKVTGDKRRLKVDPRYYRRTEVETLLGDPSKAKQKLGSEPKTTLAELVAEMVNSDYAAAHSDSLLKKAGGLPSLRLQRVSAEQS